MEILKKDLDSIEDEFAEFEKVEFKSKTVLYLSDELDLIELRKNY